MARFEAQNPRTDFPFSVDDVVAFNAGPRAGERFGRIVKVAEANARIERPDGSRLYVNLHNITELALQPHFVPADVMA